MFIDRRGVALLIQPTDPQTVTHYPQSPYGNPPIDTAKIYDVIYEAGKFGATYQKIAEKTGIALDKIGATVTNLCGKGVCNRRVLVYRLPVFNKIRLCFIVEVPREVAEKAAQEAAEPYLAASVRRRKARNARAQLGYMAVKKTDPAYLQAMAEKKAAKEALRAEKQRVRDQAKKEAAERKALEAQQRAERAALRKTKKSEAQLNNRLAEKMRGTTRGIVRVTEKPAPTIDWSRAVVTVEKARPGRYEVLEVQGMFSATRPGQYALPANSCAARAA